jgi:hypothetical protein
MQKVNTKPSMLHYFQSGERVLCRCKRHEEKQLQTKHALKAVRYERNKYKLVLIKKEHHQGFYNQSIFLEEYSKMQRRI